MNYRKKRTGLVNVFEDSRNLCECNGKLVDSILNTREHTECIREPLAEYGRAPEARFEVPCEVEISDARTLQAAKELCNRYPECRIGILNFASATNPGGGVVRGSSAQEECICRASTLYPCLFTELLHEEFYNYHRQRRDFRYTDSCIFTPEICCFKEDIQWPVLLEEKDWFTVDVISCAAPNLRGIKETAWDGRNTIRKQELQEIFDRRIEGILCVAENKKIDILVLGAFGCGAFGNSPDMVVQAFRKALQEYRYSFRAVHFAVFCPPDNRENYDVFYSALHNL